MDGATRVYERLHGFGCWEAVIVCAGDCINVASNRHQRRGAVGNKDGRLLLEGHCFVC